MLVVKLDESRGGRTGLAVGDDAVIDAHDRCHETCCAGDEGFAGALGFFDRESSFDHLYTGLFGKLFQDQPGDAAQD